MATAGPEISKHLAVIKGQLAATETRLNWIMSEHGYELLEEGFGGREYDKQIGSHIWHLLLKLEMYREHVDNFTAAVRKKYGMKELKIRRDQHEMRDIAMKGILEVQKDLEGLSPEEAQKYVDEKIAASSNRKGISSRK